MHFFAYLLFAVLSFVSNPLGRAIRVVANIFVEVGGAATVNALTGMDIIAACFLLPIGIAVYVIFGGLRATFICDWAHTIILFIVIYLFIGRT